MLPRGAGWTFEVKFDGYRALAYVRGGECTARLAERQRPDRTFLGGGEGDRQGGESSPNAVVDGEVGADRRDRAARASRELQQGTGALVYYAFDLLELDGEPLVDLPLRERKAAAARAARRCAQARSPSPKSFDDGDALFEVAKEQGLEGIVAKRLDSAYRPGRRTRDWLKVKTENNEEFVVAGYTRGSGRRAGTFGALVLAVNEGGELRYVGNVGTGFDDAEIRRLLGLLEPLQRATSPFAVDAEDAARPQGRRAVGRAAARRPGAVRRVDARRPPAAPRLSRACATTRRRPTRRRPAERCPSVIRKGKRELRLSNLDKPFWPDEGITKGDLLRYYQAVAPVLVPHLRTGPFTMRRYPDGAYGKAFFQKDAPSHMPEWIPTFRALVSTRDRERTKKWIDFPLVNDELALLWMVNMGCIDMNAWYSRVDKPDRPDFVLFDLDPTPEVPWPQTIEVALILKELLDALGLESFPKTQRRQGLPRARPARPALDLRRHASRSRRSSRARSRARIRSSRRPSGRRRGVAAS